MRILVLGSGTLRPSPSRGSPAYWIEEGPLKILLDCGAGTLRSLARFGLPWEETTHVLLSHFHTDHVGALAPFLFALKHGVEEGRTLPLEVLAPPGLREHLGHLSRAHGSYVLEPGFPLEVSELVPGEGRSLASLELSSRATRHTESSLAFRLQGPGGAFGYTGDTGPDPELGAFLHGCRVLVAECSHPDGQGMENHLTPSSLSELAGVADPELLVTVHAYPPLDPASVPHLLAGAGYTGAALPGEDGLALELGDELSVARLRSQV